jgi:hypothetical protein
VQLESLGIALPPSVGRALTQHIQKKSKPFTQGQDAVGPFRIFKSQPTMLQPVHQPEGRYGNQASRTLFRINTSYASVDTRDVHKAWPALLMKCPSECLIHGFCTVPCSIILVERGTIVVRTAHNRRVTSVIWTGETTVILNNSKTTTLPLWKALHFL